MKKSVLALLAFAVCLPLSVAGQNAAAQLQEFTQVIMLEGIPLSLVHLNDKTVPVLFQPPTVYSIRARSHDTTMLYVQGTATKPVELDSSTFTIDQGGQAVKSVPTNIKNFMKGKNKLVQGDRVDGLLTFEKAIDLSKPFAVKHGRDVTTFQFSASQIKAMTPAPAQ
jgi:hypothetical protein